MNLNDERGNITWLFFIVANKGGLLERPRKFIRKSLFLTRD